MPSLSAQERRHTSPQVRVTRTGPGCLTRHAIFSTSSRVPTPKLDGRDIPEGRAFKGGHGARQPTKFPCFAIVARTTCQAVGCAERCSIEWPIYRTKNI